MGDNMGHVLFTMTVFVSLIPLKSHVSYFPCLNRVTEVSVYSTKMHLYTHQRLGFLRGLREDPSSPSHPLCHRTHANNAMLKD